MRKQILKLITLVSFACVSVFVSCGKDKKRDPDVTTVSFPKMIQIDEGTFTMGCTTEQGSDCYLDEIPGHQVTISSFKMSATEITNAQYAAFLNMQGRDATGVYQGVRLFEPKYANVEYVNHRWQAKTGYANYPMVYVTWFGARDYCTWAGGRLPTEAEWEFAARGGNLTNGCKYAGSNNLDTVGWYRDNSRLMVHAVGTKEGNELGLYDMSGNVCEWCHDWYGNYTTRIQTNPVGPDIGSVRLIRGGSRYDYTDDCRVSSRNSGLPNICVDDIGFRLVLQ